MLYYALIKYRDQFLFTLFFIIALIISLNFNMAIDSLLSLFLSIEAVPKPKACVQIK